MSEFNKENIDRDIDRRDLTEIEQEALFALYCKHNGNHSAMSRDPDCSFHNVVIGDFAKKYNFKEKMLNKVKEEAESFNKEWNETLKKGKYKAIEKAIKLLSPAIRVIKVGKGENAVDKVIHIQPEAKEIKIAYEIIKTELGEPTTISKNTNIDENPEVKETIENIKNLITKGQEENDTNNNTKEDELSHTDSSDVQSGGETTDNNSEI